ncbi:MAG: polysaccharide deacetylase family protein [candidate division KSB1 bacterium]|nr:polysaccharide deacetylase family protein [candidate division KSB1 bacterium]
MRGRAAVLTLLMGLAATPARPQTTAEMLGHPPGTRLLIVNADDFGMCHAENVATMELLLGGHISSATAMPPCPWFLEAARFAREHPELSVGIHTTLTSEWKLYKWGPLLGAAVPSLVGPDGYFPEDTPWVETHASAEDVEKELRAQIEHALRHGLKPSHLDNHMATVYGLLTGRHFLDVVFKLCAEYGLPFRLPRNLGPRYEQALPADRVREMREMTRTLVERGFALPDYLETVERSRSYEETWQAYARLLRQLQPGVTELYIHVAVESPEIQAITGSWERRVWDYRVFKDPRTKALLDSLGVQMISYRQLQELQRRRIPPSRL